MWIMLLGAALLAAEVPSDELGDEIARVQGETGGRILVVTTSFGTKAPVERATSGLDAVVVVVEGGDDARVCGELARRGLSAAVVVRSAGARGWSVEVADCGVTTAADPTEATPAVAEAAPETPPPPAPRRPAAPRPEAPPPPAVDPRPPSPPEVPRPTTEIRAAGITSAQMRKLMALEAEVPDPTTAFWQSAIIGFGAGHFYAGDTQKGLTHAAVQATGLALVVAGVFVDDPDASAALTWVGTSTVTAGRIADLYTAPLTAHEQASRRMKKGR